MRILATTRISLRALRRNKMRSILTALGIIIGVAAVIAMVSIGNGARNQVEAQVATLGRNVILVFPGSASQGGLRGGWGSASTLTIADTEAILREIPEVIAASPEVRSRRQISVGNQNWSTTILGQSQDYLQIRQWPLAEGSMFGEADVLHASKVAVVGQTIADQLFQGENPVGEVIRVGSVPLQVIGLLAPKGLSVIGMDQDDVVFVPITTAFQHISGRSHLTAINVQVYHPSVLDPAQEKITALLRQLHRLAPHQENDFTVRNQEEIAQAATATARIMTVLLGSIASVSMVVGGIGIMNIMLVSVTERTREIGIRLAVGAHRKDILTQFLIEAVLLSCLGGLIGILLGVGASGVLSRYAEWPTLISYNAIVFAFAFSAAVGTFFGFYPARKASRLDPIEALRHE